MDRVPVNMRNINTARRVRRLGKAITEQLPLVLTEDLLEYCDVNQDRLLKVIERTLGNFGKRLVVIKAAREFINAHYTEETLSLGQVAQGVGISSSNLSTLFKLATGRSLTRSIQEIRIAWAKKLLARNDGLPITDVAKKVGFGSYVQFTVTFKARVGESPLRYRNGKLRRGSSPRRIPLRHISPVGPSTV